MSFFGKKKLKEDSVKEPKPEKKSPKKSPKKSSKLDEDKLFFDLSNIGGASKIEDQSYSSYSTHTSIDKLGIVSIKKEPIETILSNKTCLSYVPLYDYVKSKKLPSSTKIPCFGCHRNFSTPPLGIPIEFYPSVYKSENDETKIKIVTKEDSKHLPKNRILDKDYFDVDGIVCSFNCMVSVVEDNPSIIYKKSLMLIPVLYRHIYGKYPSEKIKRSPHWRLREEYGGPLTNEEFEKNLQLITLSDTNTVFRLPIVPVGKIFEININV